MLDARDSLIAGAYIVAAVLFIFGLKHLSSPASARSGNRLAAAGMLLALGATLLDRQILSFGTIAVGMLIGAGIGTYFARTVQMTAMPQMVALFNGMGGATAALVSVAEYLRLTAVKRPAPEKQLLSCSALSSARFRSPEASSLTASSRKFFRASRCSSRCSAS